MRNLGVELTDHWDRFIREAVASGRFADSGEVVREGLRLLERRDREEQARLDCLRTAVGEGIGQLDRGEGLEFDTVDDLIDHVRQIGDEVSAELGSAG